MLKFQKKRNTFTLSLVLHAVILSIFIISFEFSSRMPVLENSDKNEIVNAIIVNESRIQLPEPSPFSPPKEPDLPKKIIPKKAITPPTPPPAKVKPAVKNPPEVVVKKKTIAIPDPRKKIFKKELIEKQLLADLIKQTEKQKKENQKKEQHKSIEQEFAKELQAAETVKKLEQQMLNEKSQLSSAQMKKMQGIIDKYKALILQAISEHWLVPSGVDRGLSSELLIRVASGGAVLDVQVVKSSGDVSLDHSARAAVFKASPLPVPTKADEFAPFREFILKVKPQNVFARDNDLN